MKRVVIVVFAVGLVAGSAARAHADVILTHASLGFYNDSLGTTLDNSAGFPCANVACGDPTIPPIAPEPDLSAGAAILGDWLTSPGALNANWSGPQAIPTTWPVNTETAVVFEFNTLTPVQLTGSFGVDNGLYVWVDGVYRFGAMAPGGVGVFEYPNFDLGVVGAGTHYLQIMREDHGGVDGWAMSIDATATAVPEPATLLLLAGGVSAALVRRVRRRASA